MPISQQIISRKFAVPNVLPGQRVRLDPELLDSEGNKLDANKIICITPGIKKVSELSTLTDFTFDIQNMTSQTLTAEVIAQYDHSVQIDADQAEQTVVGASGSQPSPTASEDLQDLSVGIATGDSTGTGAQQLIAHGLGTTPRAVLAASSGGPNGNDYTIVYGAHDDTNIDLTVTNTVIYNWIALA